MRYNLFVFLITPLILFSSCDKKQPPPNIILITVDDLGWADLGCYGSTFYETPNIDRLASEGMRFTDSYAAAAVCSPTRSAIMTGKYPARTGITDWIRAEFQGGGEENREGYQDIPDRLLLCPYNPYHMELEEVTIAEILGRQGYTTCFIGKWHLGTERWYPDKQGFDYNIAGCDYGQPPSYFDPYVMYPTTWQKDTLKGFPTMEPRREGEYLTDREADEAVSFIREHRDKPFFLNLCHYAVHTPLQAKPEIIDKYEKKPPSQQSSPVYAAMVESVDDAVGSILTVLDELRLRDNTLILFTSDNGGLLRPAATNNFPLRSGKGYPYEGGIRIPTIISWRGHIEAGSLSDTPIISTDYLPTFCEVAQVSPAVYAGLDGIPLMTHILQGKSVERDAIYWHFPHYRGEDIVPYSIIRKGNWKLIKRYEGRPFELFDLESDLSESTDLAGDQPEMVSELNAELELWLQEIDAKMPRAKDDTGND